MKAVAKSVERWEPGLILVRLGILARQAAVSSVQGYQFAQQGRPLRLDGLCQVIVEPRARAGGPCRLPSSLEKATDGIQAASSGKALRSSAVDTGRVHDAVSLEPMYWAAGSPARLTP